MVCLDVRGSARERDLERALLAHLRDFLSAPDERLRRNHDEPSIGLILCKERNRVVVEYALRGSNRPIGVAEYRLTSTLPRALRGKLPSPEELRRGLESGG